MVPYSYDLGGGGYFSFPGFTRCVDGTREKLFLKKKSETINSYTNNAMLFFLGVLKI